MAKLQLGNIVLEQEDGIAGLSNDWNIDSCQSTLSLHLNVHTYTVQAKGIVGELQGWKIRDRVVNTFCIKTVEIHF